MKLPVWYSNIGIHNYLMFSMTLLLLKYSSMISKYFFIRWNQCVDNGEVMIHVMICCNLKIWNPLFSGLISSKLLSLNESQLPRFQDIRNPVHSTKGT